MSARPASQAITSGVAAALADALIADPARFYGSPYQLAWDSKLGRHQRLDALRRWLRAESRAYRTDRRPAHLARMRDLRNAIRVVEHHEI